MKTDRNNGPAMNYFERKMFWDYYLALRRMKLADWYMVVKEKK